MQNVEFDGIDIMECILGRKIDDEWMYDVEEFVLMEDKLYQVSVFDGEFAEIGFFK